MPFSDFLGNETTVQRLRALIAGQQMGRSVALAGPAGLGKTTLAAMIGLALNCEQPPQAGDFCGVCASCSQLTAVSEWDALSEEAAEFRDEEVKTRAKETAPLVVSPHPQIRYFPPDGDFITMGQAREAMRLAQLHPGVGKSWALVLPELERARWIVQTAMLKTLEEPPAGACFLLLVHNPMELLPTVRSRSLILQLAPAPRAEIEKLLGARRPELAQGPRELLARLAQGCPGRALGMDLDAYRELRKQAFLLLRGAQKTESHSELFRVTEQWRAGKETFESLHEILYSVLQDILYLISDRSDSIRNVDCHAELAALASFYTPGRIAAAVKELDLVLSAARRNANRPLALDAWALRLAEAQA